MRAEVLERDGDVCGYCREPIDLDLRKPHPRSFVMAHIIPHADGGEYVPENLRPAHRDCNAIAGKTPPGGA